VLGAIPTPYQTSSTTNGTAVFTPPNGALQAITSTALLTCAFATFRDGSTNNYTITVNSATVSTQNPFPLTTLPNPAQGNAGNGIFSMSQYQSLKQQNLWPAIDPYFRNTTLLLHGNGTNGAQNNTFLDSSSNNFTITRNGNTTQGTFTPYGSNWSNYFNGTDAKLTMASSATMSLTAEFTIECWVNWNGTSTAYQNFVGSNDTFTSNASFFRVWGSVAGAQLGSKIGIGNPTHDGTSSVYSVNSIPTNTWVHVAATRDSSNIIRVFINGVLERTGSTDTSTYNFGQGGTCIGDSPWDGANGWYSGFISNLRVIKGTALYTSSFTPPSGPLQNITNTSLLTCQSNRFIDNSSNAFAITVNGSPSVQRFSPFNPSAPYAAGTIGGSGYFDGNGDYLTVTSSTAFDMTGDFTVEMWVYPITLNATNGATVFSCGATSLFQLNTLGAGTKIEWYSTTNPPIISVSYSGYLQLNQWNHLVACRTGTTLAIFVNGTRLGTATDNTSYDLSQLYLSYQPGSSHFLNGYMGDVRVIKGSGPYNATQSTLTVPTAPLTAITNTSLLCSFTNGGIIDNAMMNDLETVGNAQISTTQSKFGGSSINLSGGANWLLMASSQNFAMGTGDFTVEAWVYPTSSLSAAYNVVFSVNATGGLYFGNTTTGFGLRASSVGDICVTTVPSVNTWTHIAVTRSGTTVRLFYNGVQQNSATSSQNFVVGTGNIGSDGSGSNNWPGYIDDLRITKGYARYTSNFTPQTSQWQDQ
jgi:hypothetical protein